MSVRTIFFAWVLSLCMLQSAVDAAIFEYTGTVYRIFDNFDALGTDIQIGTTVSGSFSYDATQAPDFFDPDPNFTYASWDLTGPDTSFNFQTTGLSGMGSGNFQTAEGFVDPTAGSAFNLVSEMSWSQLPDGSLPPGFSYTSLGGVFLYFESTAQSSVPIGQLITEFNPLSQWDGEFAVLGMFPKGEATFFITDPNGFSQLVQFNFELTSVTAVPEPASCTFLFASTLGLLSKRGRKLLGRHQPR